jgi:hypothetical protein
MRRISGIVSVIAVAMVTTSCSEIFKAACKNTLARTSSGPIADPALDEISGLGVGIVNPDVFWVHNDSGDSARMFAIDAHGSVRGTYALSGATNVDWEDLAVVPGPTAGSGTVYLADIGDNGALRSEIQVYRVAEPVVPLTGPPATTTLTAIETLRFTYPDGARDAEALIVDPVSGDLTIVTKSLLSGAQDVYSAPAGLPADSTTVLAKVGQVKLDPGFLSAVTGADITADGTTIAIRTYGGVKLYHRTTPTTVANALITPIGPCSVSVPNELQGEAIGFGSDGRSIVTVSEGTGQALHIASVP